MNAGRLFGNRETIGVEEADLRALEVELDDVRFEKVAAEQPVLPAGLRTRVARSRIDQELEVASEPRAASVRIVLRAPDRDAEGAGRERGQDGERRPRVE